VVLCSVGKTGSSAVGKTGEIAVILDRANRSARLWRMGTIIQDLKYSLRMFRLSPGFTFTAIATLALAIGANTAIFSLINSVLLRPLPHPHPERIVQLLGLSRGETYPYSSVPRFNAYREQSQVFEQVAAYDWRGNSPVSLTEGDRPEQVRGERVSFEYFRLFSVPFIAGRGFSLQEDRPGGGRVAILSAGFWQRRFASDRGVLGKSISLGGDSYTVVGVVSPAFEPDPPVDVWLPLQANPNSVDQAAFFFVAARLKSGVTLDQAKTALQAAADEFRRKFPDAMGASGSFTAEPLSQNLTHSVRLPLLVLLGAVACVLLVACANLANLLLARGAGRAREMAVRAAIGAGRGRIIRQLLTESILLSLIGGTVGVIAGPSAVRALVLSAGDIPRIGQSGAAVALDASVLAFSLLLTVFTGVLFGLVPAFHASRIDLQTALKESGSRSGSRRQNRTHGFIIVAEMAVAFVLLTGAGLLVRSFIALRKVAPGFDAHHILTLESALNGARFEHTAAIASAVQLVEERLAAMPGLEAVAVAPSAPLESSIGMGFRIAGRPLGDRRNHGGGWWRYVTWRYFDVYKIPVLRGRGFSARDGVGAPPVVLISETMARKFWPSGNPIGERILLDNGDPQSREPYREIVGVVADVRELGLREEPGAATYVPLPQVPDEIMATVKRIGPLTWAIRAKSQASSLTEAVRHEIESTAGLSADRARWMDQVIYQSTARDGFNALLLVIFAAVAILLASIGLYGVISYSIKQRAQEFGIRLALGASPSHLRIRIVGQAMTFAVIGIMIGVAGALALTRLLASMLFGIKATDLPIFISVALLMVLIAFLASLNPALRAALVDPMAALRCE